MAGYTNVEKSFLDTLRQWAIQRLKDYLVKGFAVNQQPPNYAN